MPQVPLRFFRLILIPSFVALSFGACAYRNEKNSAGVESPHSAQISPSFAQVREQVFVPKCTTCHHHQNDFSDYAKTFAERDGIQQRVFVDHTMPQGDVLSADQSSLLKQWLDAGAPEQAQQPTTTPVTPAPTPTPTPTVTPDPVDPVAVALVTIRNNFEQKIRPLVNRSCVACHDSHSVPEGVLGHLPGIRQREWNHIRNASKVMDFSRTFPSWSAQNSDPVFFLEQIRASLELDKMPTADFRFAHSLDGRLLTLFEKQELIEWTVDSERLLALADNSKPTAMKIVQNRCLGCHSAGTHDGGLTFDVTSGDLKVLPGTASGGIPFMVPGSPETSAIYLVLLPDAQDRKGLPAMPENSGSVSDQERDLISDWIKAQH